MKEKRNECSWERRVVKKNNQINGKIHKIGQTYAKIMKTQQDSLNKASNATTVIKKFSFLLAEVLEMEIISFWSFDFRVPPL